MFIMIFRFSKAGNICKTVLPFLWHRIFLACHWQCFWMLCICRFVAWLCVAWWFFGTYTHILHDSGTNCMKPTLFPRVSFISLGRASDNTLFGSILWTSPHPWFLFMSTSICQPKTPPPLFRADMNIILKGLVFIGKARGIPEEF